MHTTNYLDTLICPADDCPAAEAQIPPIKADKQTIANFHFDLISRHPYEYTSDDVIFMTQALKNEVPRSAWKEERERFFSKGQACLRSSPLTKRYGWAIHNNSEGKVNLIAPGSPEYQHLFSDSAIKKTKGMRSKRA